MTASKTVDVAIDFMERNLGLDVSLDEVCLEVGVGPRTLQKAFKESLGCTPMGWLRQRRLDVARVKLMAATSDQTVTSIACDLGITHLGRFAVEYRRRHGVSPSSTLAMQPTS